MSESCVLVRLSMARSSEARGVMQTSNGPGPAAAAAHVTSESSGGSTSDGDGGISTAAAASHPESPIRDNTGMDLSATSSASPDLSTPNSPLHGASYMQSDVSDWSKKRRRPTGFFNNNSNDLSQQQQQQQSSSSLPSIDGENHALQNETSNTEVNSEHRTGPTEQDETKATGAAGDVYDTSRNDKEDQQEQPPASPQLAQHQQQVKDVTPLDITYRSTPASLRLKDSLVMRLAMAFPSGRIQVIDLSRRGLTEETAELIGNTLRCNPTLAVLKLGYNDLGDKGTSVIASACSKDGRHHQNLTVLDLAFNEIGDEGCTALSLHMIAGNHTLRNLSLSGNNIRRKGATALAGAFMHGCALSRLRLSSNRIGREGTRLLAQAIAESENRVQQLMQRQGGIKIGYNIKPVTLEELFLDDTSMKAKGFATLSSMLITNYNLSTLSLTNNNVDDQDMALLSQALAQNKQLPLKSLILSFNNISCVGVECLMNAVWGSPTLREIKLDNNKIQDRGAQLCSVVLSSIRLAVLDISFNKITTVGIKALMKSLSENDSLQSLALCGIPMDQNASKAVSYALAYNQSLNRFNIDSCGVGYSGQRHIVAGIVSNRNVKLRALTGFPLAPITMTLGVPQLPEDWGNDRILSFIRFMWSDWSSNFGTRSAIDNVNRQKTAVRGPAAPSMVAAAAKRAFSALSESDDAKVQYQNEYQSSMEDDNPMVAPETSILVRSNSGRNLQMPTFQDQLETFQLEPEAAYAEESWHSDTDSFDRSSYTGSSESLHNALVTAASVDSMRRNKNLGWLRSHMQSLVEVGNLGFNNADLWQLHQYFFSPAYTAEDELENEEDRASSNGDSTVEHPPTPAPSEVGKADMGRAISFQTLKKAVNEAAAAEEAKRPNKRGSLDDELQNYDEPCAKRPKQLKPRIAFYPRVREKLESLGTKPSTQTLCLLRQLKYVESVMLKGKSVYSRREMEEDEGPNTADVEMVLLDLL